MKRFNLVVVMALFAMLSLSSCGKTIYDAVKDGDVKIGMTMDEVKELLFSPPTSDGSPAVYNGKEIGKYWRVCPDGNILIVGFVPNENGELVVHGFAYSDEDIIPMFLGTEKKSDVDSKTEEVSALPEIGYTSLQLMNIKGDVASIIWSYSDDHDGKMEEIIRYKMIFENGMLVKEYGFNYQGYTLNTYKYENNYIVESTGYYDYTMGVYDEEREGIEKVRAKLNHKTLEGYDNVKLYYGEPVIKVYPLSKKEMNVEWGSNFCDKSTGLIGAETLEDNKENKYDEKGNWVVQMYTDTTYDEPVHCCETRTIIYNK